MTGTLLTTQEVAERLGLSSAAIAQAVRTGALQPTARTNEDFLFTERAVAAFAERRAEAAATPLEPPPAVSRAEWSGDLDRLNSWLKDLNESTPAMAQPVPPAAGASPPPASFMVPVPAPTPIATPEEARPAIDFRPPPHPVAEPPAAAPPQPQPETVAEPAPAPEPEPVPQPVAEAAPAPEPEPVPQPVAETAPAPEPAPAPLVVAEAPPEPEQAPVAPAAREAVEETHLPTLAEATAPLPEPVAALKSGLSRQAVLVVQPVARFRVLRDVADRLATIPGVSDARLERLEGGVASYRVSFEAERPGGDTIGTALASLNLEVILVDSVL